MTITPEEAVQVLHNYLSKKDIDGELIAAVFEYTFALVESAEYNDQDDTISVVPIEGFTEEEVAMDLDIYSWKEE